MATAHLPDPFYDIVQHHLPPEQPVGTLGGVEVVIRDPGCVRKTYPAYFDDFRRLTQ